MIETRRLLEDAGTRRDAVEREMRAAAETGKYLTAQKRQAEINNLAREATRLADELKILRAADERRRVELHTLRESARSLRMEMKRAADSFEFLLASEKQVEARAVQAECEALQAALREMRRDPTTGKTGGDDEEESSAASKSGLTSATVRVSPFDPFGITVGKNELTVTLIDTPGYGDNLNTVESFDVITAHVEGLFKAQLLAETSATTRDYDRLRNEDPLVRLGMSPRIPLQPHHDLPGSSLASSARAFLHQMQPSPSGITIPLFVHSPSPIPLRAPHAPFPCWYLPLLRSPPLPLSFFPFSAPGALLPVLHRSPPSQAHRRGLHAPAPPVGQHRAHHRKVGHDDY